MLRELLRLETAEKRLEMSLKELIGLPVYDILHDCLSHFTDAKSNLLQPDLSLERIENAYDELNVCVSYVMEQIQPLCPLHRPVDIQTSDAGPGVSTGEEIVRLRLVEQFLLNNLDLQARFHYAPLDSKSHPVERVMSALNDAVGDGRYIPLPNRNILDNISETELLQISPAQLKSAQQVLNDKASYICAEMVASRYTGTRSLGTTIHAKVANKQDLRHNFFFDETYIKAWHDAKSAVKKTACAGSSYYQFLSSQFDKHYIKYDNGVEGIRKDSPFIVSGLSRIPPPVPDYSSRNEKGEWHYYDLTNLPDKFKDVENSRVPNDFCPRTQLNRFVDTCGEPIVKSKYDDIKQTFIIFDSNETLAKIENGIPEFAASYTGMDVQHIAKKDAEKIYLRKIKKLSQLHDSAKTLLNAETYHSVTQRDLKIKIVKANMSNPLPWNGWCNGIEMTNTCTVDNVLFFFHKLQTYREDIQAFLSSSDIPSLKLLYDVHNHFKQNKFTEGKYIWLAQFFPVGENVSQWDAHGDEDTYSFDPLAANVSTTYTSTCSNKETCSEPMRVLTSKLIGFQ